MTAAALRGLTVKDFVSANARVCVRINGVKYPIVHYTLEYPDGWSEIVLETEFPKVVVDEGEQIG